MKRFGFITLIFILSLAWMAWAAPTPVKDTRHNLSTSGTGTYKSDILSVGGTSEICVFCHTPHHGNTDAPLWNRKNPTSYTPYTSDVMSALSYTGDDSLGTGALHVKTRICLSCHDGTIAMGNLVNLPQGLTADIPILNAPGGFMPPAAAGYIGANLSDDHPVAIKYVGLTPDPELRSTPLPAISPGPGGPIRLYPNAGTDYVECTSCHNPHDNQYGNFLVGSNTQSGICIACHNKTGFATSIHNTNSAVPYAPPTGALPASGNPTTLGSNVGEVKCMNCHFPHRAGITAYGGGELPSSGKYLLTYQEEKSCFNTTNRWNQATTSCHGSGVPVGDKRRIEPELSNISRHNISAYVNKHQSVEVKSGTPNGWFSSSAWHVECADCHNPHSAGTSVHTQGTNIISSTSSLYGVAYVSVSVAYPGGSWAAPTLYNPVEPLGATTSASWSATVKEYEVCFKCHSYFASGGVSFPNAFSSIQQMSDQSKEFNATTSFHPVVTSNTNTYGAMINGWNTGTQLMYCSDCHTKEDYSNANRPKGPHGSANKYLLSYPYYDDKAPSGSGDDDNLSGTLCLACHDPSTYSSGAGTNTGFYTTGGINLHTQHYAVRNNPLSLLAYRCVNCHIRTPHGWDRKGMVHLQGDNASHANGAWYEPLSGPTITGFNGGALPNSRSYGPGKGDNCFTIAGCHQ